jgi:hypothetical protein
VEPAQSQDNGLLPLRGNLQRVQDVGADQGEAENVGSNQPVYGLSIHQQRTDNRRDQEDGKDHSSDARDVQVNLQGFGYFFR